MVSSARRRRYPSSPTHIRHARHGRKLKTVMAQLTLVPILRTGHACIAVGLNQLLRQRGPGQRARGYAFVYAMLVADATALLVFQSPEVSYPACGGADSVNLAVRDSSGDFPCWRTPRPQNWKNCIITGCHGLCRVMRRLRTSSWVGPFIWKPEGGLGGDRRDVGARHHNRLYPDQSLRPAESLARGMQEDGAPSCRQPASPRRSRRSTRWRAASASPDLQLAA